MIGASCVPGKEAMPRLLVTLARMGTVGRAARWASNVYHRAMQRRMRVSTPQELASLLLATRYRGKAESNPDGREDLTWGLLQDLNNEGQIQGTAHLIALILVAEAGFAENGRFAQTDFMDAIIGVLQEEGVPDSLVFGERTTGRHPAMLVDLYWESTQHVNSQTNGGSAW